VLIFNQAINHALDAALADTQKRLRVLMYSISTPNARSHLLFIRTWKALENCIKRGVETKIILSDWPPSNPQQAASIKAALLLRLWGANVKTANHGVIFHPKAWCFDDATLIVGSHNATEAGLTRTQNISYIGQEPAEIGQFNDFFASAWGKLGEHV